MVVTNYLLSGMILQVVAAIDITSYMVLYIPVGFRRISEKKPTGTQPIRGLHHLDVQSLDQIDRWQPLLVLERQLSDASPHPSHVMCWSPERIEFGGVFHQPIWRKRCASKKLETVSLGMKIKHIGKDHLGRLLVRGLCLSKAKMFVF